jgi:hypothetical protein
MPEYIYYKPVPYQVDAAEILKEIGEKPHLLLRISIRGGYFPHRNAPAFARLQERQTTFDALYCEIDDDERGFRAYFATDVPLQGVLSIGFENVVVAEFELERLNLEPNRLDDARIETAFHRVLLDDPGIFKLQQ